MTGGLRNRSTGSGRRENGRKRLQGAFGIAGSCQKVDIGVTGSAIAIQQYSYSISLTSIDASVAQ